MLSVPPFSSHNQLKFPPCKTFTEKQKKTLSQNDLDTISFSSAKLNRKDLAGLYFSTSKLEKAQSSLLSSIMDNDPEGIAFALQDFDIHLEASPDKYLSPNRQHFKDLANRFTQEFQEFGNADESFYLSDSGISRLNVHAEKQKDGTIDVKMFPSSVSSQKVKDLWQQTFKENELSVILDPKEIKPSTINLETLQKAGVAGLVALALAGLTALGLSKLPDLSPTETPTTPQTELNQHN